MFIAPCIFHLLQLPNRVTKKHLLLQALFLEKFPFLLANQRCSERMRRLIFASYFHRCFFSLTQSQIQKFDVDLILQFGPKK